MVDDIKSQTNVYTPIVEAIANSIESITSKNIKDGKVEVVIIRSGQGNLVNEIPEVQSVHIVDNGVGFNKKNRDAFDTFKTYHKKNIGGKGFGRFLPMPGFANELGVRQLHGNDLSTIYQRKRDYFTKNR